MKNKEVWVVSGGAADTVYGVFTTQRKARAYREQLDREGIVVFITKRTLNK